MSDFLSAPLDLLDNWRILICCQLSGYFDKVGERHIDWPSLLLRILNAQIEASHHHPIPVPFHMREYEGAV